MVFKMLLLIYFTISAILMICYWTDVEDAVKDVMDERPWLANAGGWLIVALAIYLVASFFLMLPLCISSTIKSLKRRKERRD